MIRVQLLALLVASSAVAQDAFPIPSIDWAKGIHGHGDMLWVAASNQGLLEIARGGAVARVADIRSAIAVGGHEDVVVTAGYDKQLWRRRNGRWERGPVVPEIRFGDGVQAIVVAPNGDAYIAARYALHRWRGNRLQTFNAERELQTVAFADGRAFTGGRDSLYELREGSLQNATFHDALRDELGGRAPAATGLFVADDHLWIAVASRKLAEVDLASNRVAFHTHPLFGSVRSFASAGGRLFIGAQSEIGVLEGTGFRQFGTRVSFPEGFHLDGSTLYVTNRDGLTAIDAGAGSPIVRPVAQITTSTTSSSMSSSMSSAMSSTMSAQASGVRIENLNASGCGLIGAMAIGARAQEAAGRCVAAGQSVNVRMTLQNGRPTSVTVTSDVARARSCAQRRLRRMRVPGAAPSCEVTLTVAH